MKKLIVLFFILALALPLTCLARQYSPETGKRRFDATPEITYSAFIRALKSNNYEVISTDSKNYITAFNAGGYSFTSTIIADGKKESLMQIVPVNPNKMVPLTIYRRVFTITEEIISKPDAKNRTFYFLN